MITRLRIATFYLLKREFLLFVLLETILIISSLANANGYGILYGIPPVQITGISKETFPTLFIFFMIIPNLIQRDKIKETLDMEILNRFPKPFIITNYILIISYIIPISTVLLAVIFAPKVTMKFSINIIIMYLLIYTVFLLLSLLIGFVLTLFVEIVMILSASSVSFNNPISSIMFARFSSFSIVQFSIVFMICIILWILYIFKIRNQDYTI